MDAWPNFFFYFGKTKLEEIIVERFSCEFCIYCAFFDKSTNFGIELEKYIIKRIRCGAIGYLPPSGHRGPFFKKTAYGG